MSDRPSIWPGPKLRVTRPADTGDPADSGDTRSRRSPQRRAVALVSLLMFLVLLGVFALIASQVFLSATRLTHAAQASQTRTIRFDAMLSQMREDVWTASQLNPAADSLKIGDAAGEHVTWRVEPGGAILRIAEAPPRRPDVRRWDDLDTSIKFEAHGPAVLISIRDSTTRQTDEVTLPSLVLLSRKEMP